LIKFLNDLIDDLKVPIVDILDVTTIALKTGLSEEEIAKL